jgi:hypothetical protein
MAADPELVDVVDVVDIKPIKHLDPGTPGFSARFAFATRRAKLAAIREQVDRGELIVRQATAADLDALEVARARRRAQAPQTLYW